MRFLRSAKSVDAELKKANEEAAARVAEIKKPAVEQTQEFITNLKELQDQVARLAAGPTPIQGIDLKAFQRFISAQTARTVLTSAQPTVATTPPPPPSPDPEAVAVHDDEDEDAV